MLASSSLGNFAERVLGTRWFLMEIDGNYRGMDGDCREIDLIRGSHPPYRKREIKREKCTNALTIWFILH